MSTSYSVEKCTEDIFALKILFQWLQFTIYDWDFIHRLNMATLRCQDQSSRALVIKAAEVLNERTSQ